MSLALKAERHLANGDFVKAAAVAKETILNEPKHLAALEILAKALWQTNEREELMDVLARLIELNPYEPGYHVLRGAVLQSMGHCGEAMRSFERGLEQGSDLDGSIAQMVSELGAWQDCLIAGLLQDDLVFRVEYLRDAQQACRSRGFEPIATHAIVRRLPIERIDVAVVARPS
jgi:Flp pilus assembly protein TadD